MTRILSKSMKRKSKKGVSWAQSGRNTILTSKVKSLEAEIELLNLLHHSLLMTIFWIELPSTLKIFP